MAALAGTFIALEGHVVKFTRPVQLPVNLPEDFAGFEPSGRDDPGKVAGFTTDIQMCVMSDLCIMPLVAAQTRGPFLPGMAKLRGFRVAGKTR